jgi:single-stranded DNA-binding protein
MRLFCAAIMVVRTAGLEGRIQTRSWEKDRVKQYKSEIVAERVQ